MKIIGDFSNQKQILQSKEGEKVYCTVEGVLQEVVYSKVNENQSEYYENVRLTKQSRLRLQQSSTSQASFNISQREDDLTVYPIYVFDYSKLIIERGGIVEYWGSSIGDLHLEQTTEVNKPILGEFANGVNGFSPLYFNRSNSSFMSLNSPITITGDFTMFFYINPIAIPNHKQYRLLGKSDDNDMYLSIGESYNESYNLSFSSSSEVVVSTTGYWQPSSRKLLITIQRNNNKIYIRENGTQVFNGVIPITDFTFDQIGKIGNISIPTFNGSIYHFSAYNGYLYENLDKLENSIIKNSELAKG
jgi:hypothetical protein